MYGALNELRGKFVYVRVAMMPGYYEVAGKIESVTRESLTLTTYNPDGTDPTSEIFPLGTILMVSHGGLSLDRLKANVCLHLEAAARDR